MSNTVRISLVILCFIVVIPLTACGLVDQLDHLIDSADALQLNLEDMELDELISYPNNKRAQVLEPYVGEKADLTRAEVLLDNIILHYYETDDPNEFEIYIENTNVNYFFDGIVSIWRDNERYNIRVDMLAPQNVEFFNIIVEHDDFGEYYYQPRGDMYLQIDTISIDYDYYVEVIDYEYSEYALVVDIPEIEEEIILVFAEYLYISNTYYNFYFPNTYYLFTKEQVDADNIYYDRYLLVDTSQQIAILYDSNQRVIQHFKF